MQSLVRDVRYAFRLLSKSPGFAAVAVLSLALGIGPNTAIFSVVSSLFMGDRGVQNPERTVEVFLLTRSESHSAMGYSTYELIEEGNTDVYSGVTAYTNITGSIEIDGTSVVVSGDLVSGNHFEVLGVTPLVGRAFLPEEDETPGTHAVTVLSERFWRAYLGSDPGVVGHTIRLNTRPYTVVGVIPSSFTGKAIPGMVSDFWAPIMTYEHLLPSQMRSGNLWVTGRLRDGVPVERAVAATTALAAQVDAQRTDSNSRFRLAAVPGDGLTMHPDLDKPIRAMVTLLMVVVGLVLLVACINLAGFLLARATDRRKEMAIRVAMGAGQGSIIRQLLIESLLLAGMGGLLGLGLGALAVKLIMSVDLPLGVPVILDVQVDGRALLFTSVATLLAGLIFGLAPALHASRAPVASTLRDEAGSSGGRGKGLARNLLVGGQMALSMVLLVGAGLFLRSLGAALDVDPGFSVGPAAILTVDATPNGYDGDHMVRLGADLLRNAEELSGVRAAAITTRIPLHMGVSNRSLEVPGVPAPQGADYHRLEYAAVSSGYFDVMELEILRGRAFTDADNDESRTVIILSEAAARLWWPGEEAVGKVVHPAGDLDTDWVVVGVAGNAKIWSLTEAPRPYFYRPFAQSPQRGFHVVARGPVRAGQTANDLRAMARAVDPELFIPEVKTMEEHLGYALYLPRMAAAMLGMLGALALILACVGLYGLVSYGVAQRTREVGIRIALGSQPQEAVKLVMKGGILLVGVGGVVGLAIAVWASGLLGTFLIGIDPRDVVTFVTVPALLGVVALLATWIPARRASRVNPVDALRAE